MTDDRQQVEAPTHLIPFVPALVHRNLLAEGPPEEERRCDMQAALLMADISGFTALTEKLALKGGEAAEQLSALLNVCFGKLINRVIEHGGDIHGFAGDSLTAFWTADEEGKLEDAVTLAAACALAAQEELSGFRVADGVSISLRIGIGAGSLSSYQVGGVYGRWECLLSGAALGQAGAAEQRARPGQVLLSPEAWGVACGRLQGRPKAQGMMRLRAVLEPPELPGDPRANLPPLQLSGLRSFLPGVVLSRGTAAHSAFLSELRRVTTIFLSLGEFQTGVDQKRVQCVVRELQTALYRGEGSINKLAVDSKGVVLLAALGLPPLAHHDDAARALNVALDFHERLTRLRVRHAIGVTSGRAFCGTIGNEQRCEYTLIGDCINIAARLMQEAQALPDADGRPLILCDEQTHRHTAEHFEFDDLPPLVVRGRRDALAVHRIVRRVNAVRQHHDIIGREQERGALGDAIQGMLRTGKSRLVVIEGDAGIGKSCLLSEFRRLAEQHGLTILHGIGDPVEQNTPYQSWRPAVSALLGVDPNASTRIQGEQVLSALRGEWEERAPLLNQVLPVTLPDTDFTQALSGPELGAAVRQFVVDLLGAAVERGPKALLLEDAQWLDPSSWGLLHEVMDKVSPLLIAVATRPVARPTDAHRALLSHSATSLLRLRPLDRQDVEALVCQRLGVGAVPAELVSFVQSRAEGNPFFCQELTYALRDSGLLQVVKGQCRLTRGAGSFDSLEFPTSIEGVVLSRIDKLEPSQQMALKVASVIGRVFALTALRTIHPVDNERQGLPETVARLGELDLTPLLREAPEPEYIFKHIITQDVTYNLMLYSLRRDLHKAMACWLEETRAEDLAPFYGSLAYHWQRGGDLDKAREYGGLAGDRAMHAAAYVEAVGHYRQAIKTLAEMPAGEERAALELPLQMKLAHPVMITRGYSSPELKEVYDRARELCSQVGEAPDLFQVVHGIWTHYIIAGALDPAWEVAEHCVRLAEQADRADFRLEALLARANTLYWRGQVQESLEEVERLVALYQEGDRSSHIVTYGQDPLIAAYSFGAWGKVLAGYPTTALQWADRAYQTAEALDNEYCRIMAWQDRGFTACHAELWRQGRNASQAMVNLAREKDAIFWHAVGRVALGRALAGDGLVQEGLTLCRAGAEACLQLGARLTVTINAFWLAECCELAGEWDEGLRVVDEGLEAAEDGDALCYESELTRVQGRLLVGRSHEHAPDAEDCFLRAFDMAEEAGLHLCMVRAATDLAVLRLEGGGSLDKALDLLEEAVEAFPETGDYPPLNRARELLRQQGR